ncbi:MAG: hypothetical protein IIB19_01690 [Chloroflexi bacterium]|nr:hypothetical protein [Chloroflexota bacterium]
MKRYVLIAGLLVLFSLAAGCSLGDESELPTQTIVQQEPDATVTLAECAVSLRAGCQVTIMNSAGDSVLIRETPSTTATTVGPVRNGTMAVILSGPTEAEGRPWYEIQTSEISGFTEATFLFP